MAHDRGLQQVSDMVLCTTPWIGYALGTGDADASMLRCNDCGRKVQLELHHLEWYGC